MNWLSQECKEQALRHLEPEFARCFEAFAELRKIASSSPKAVDRQGIANISGAAFLPVFERNSGPVGELHHRIEGGDRCAHIDEACITNGAPHVTTYPGEPELFASEHGIDELHQHHAVWHATVRAVAADDRCQIVTRTSCRAALTEQSCMAGGSIEARVDCRSSSRNQLDLPVADGAVLPREVADLVILEVELDIEIEEVEDLLRHEAQRQVDILVAV